jgi:porphyrinogen peroxidase
MMLTPQPGIFALGDGAHGFFEFALRQGADGEAALAALVSVREPQMTIGGTNRVVGIRPSLWRTLSGDDAPDNVNDLDQPIVGPDGFGMPATQADLWLWLAASGYDVVFDMGKAVIEAVAPYADLVREERGWSYRHNRDLTGFEDGTENPTLSEAPEIAVVADGERGAGGSVLLFQKWKHPPQGFSRLAEQVQEDVIGRTKIDSVELDDAHMPADSHVSRTTLVVDGVERDIFRRNIPYGMVSDHGTIFIGFSSRQAWLQRMLEQMAGINGPRDALTRYTTPQTGAYYFVPSVQALRRFTKQG